MDTFGWAGAGQDDDVYLARPAGQGSCGRFELDDAFLGGACFGQLQRDGVGGDAAACHVNSTSAADLANDPLGCFFSSGPDVFASVVDGCGSGAHDDGLLDAALAFSRGLVSNGDVDGRFVSNGAVLSSHSGTTGGNVSSGESNNYSGVGHDAEVASPTSTISPTTTSAQAFHPKRKLGDDYPAAIATAPPLERLCAKRKATTTTTTSITFGQGNDEPAAGAADYGYEPDMEAMAQVKEMIYRAAAMRPVSLVTEPTPENKPRRKNVRISSDPQTVAARLRRERVSERLRVLQKLVPGGSKMDTASMLDEAASYLKFLKSQVQALETLGSSGSNNSNNSSGTARLQQQYYRNNSAIPGFARNNLFPNRNGNATELL